MKWLIFFKNALFKKIFSQISLSVLLMIFVNYNIKIFIKE
jgi:hypothetical protein